MVDDLDNTLIGKAYGPVIVLKKTGEPYTYFHELEHVKQWYKSLFLHGLFYKYNRAYRLKCEIEAYKVSIEHGRPLNSAARGLQWVGYGFDLKFAEAKGLLS